MKTLGLAFLAIGMAIGFAAPAAAGETEYLNKLQTQFVFLTADQLLTEGHKACELILSGQPGSEVVPIIVKDIGVSSYAAIQIVTTAVREFNC